jgi:hypothetical protein
VGGGWCSPPPTTPLLLLLLCSCIGVAERAWNAGPPAFPLCPPLPAAATAPGSDGAETSCGDGAGSTATAFDLSALGGSAAVTSSSGRGGGDSSGAASLRQWRDYMFVNYRAVQAPHLGERIYGNFYVESDRVGVLLDMDAGTLSFIRDAIEYGTEVRRGRRGGGGGMARLGPAAAHTPPLPAPHCVAPLCSTRSRCLTSGSRVSGPARGAARPHASFSPWSASRTQAMRSPFVAASGSRATRRLPQLTSRRCWKRRRCSSAGTPRRCWRWRLRQLQRRPRPHPPGV